MIIQLIVEEERGKEFKVPYYANTAAVYDGNLPHVKAICLMLRQFALHNCHFPLFPTLGLNKNYSNYKLKAFIFV